MTWIEFISTLSSRSSRIGRKLGAPLLGILDRETDGWITLGLVSYALAITSWLVANHSEPLIDDGFYYLRIAQFIASGMGSTYDGINPTNGYHPLWLSMLVPVFWFTSGPEAARLVSICMQGLFFAASVSLFYLTTRLQVGRFAAVAATSLWVLLTYNQSLGGTEFSIHALSVLATAYVYLHWFTREQSQDIRRYLILGLLSSITFLARLDTMLLSVTLGVFLIRREYRGGSARAGVVRLTAFGLPILLVCFVYACANLISFGHVLPVSAAVKGSWSAYYLSQSPIFLAHGWLAAKVWLMLFPLRLLAGTTHLLYLLFPLSMSAGVFGTFGLWVAFMVLPPSYSIKKSVGRFAEPLAPFILYSLTSFLIYVVIYQDFVAYYSWYYVIQPWLSSILFAVLIDHAIRPILSIGRNAEAPIWIRRLSTLALIALGLAIPIYTVRQIWPGASDAPALTRDPLYQAAIWIKENTAQAAILGSWNAGIISFYSGHRVVNLDGLVNSWDFYERGQYNLCRYWRDIGISYLADGFEGDHALSPVPSFQNYAACAERLELLWAKPVPNSQVQIKIYRIRWIDN